jgi:hypothetical protein
MICDNILADDMMSSDYVMLLLSHDLLSDFIDLADGII